jgi:uncharacterized membrane protein YqiK
MTQTQLIALTLLMVIPFIVVPGVFLGLLIWKTKKESKITH